MLSRFRIVVGPDGVESTANEDDVGGEEHDAGSGVEPVSRTNLMKRPSDSGLAERKQTVPGETGDTAVVRAERLTKRFGETLAVDDLSFALERGTITGFLGPNGAGKTTTLRMLLHLVEPTSGRALEIFTTEPGLQFYAGSGFAQAPRGKGGFTYSANAALALETQHFPDSPNHPGFPSTILRPGERFRSRSIYRFSTA